MRARRIASVAFTGAAAAAATGFAAQPALAAGTYTVNPGGAYGAYNVSPTLLVDTTTGVTLTCGLAHADGSLHNGSGSPAPIGTINAAGPSQTGTWFGSTSSPCSFVGVTFTATLNKGITLYASSYANGVTKGYVGGSSTSAISATLTGQNVSCHAVITGSKVPGSFDNATNVLNINPGHQATLKVKSATGCLNEIHAGDSAYFAATYSPSPSQTITGS